MKANSPELTDDQLAFLFLLDTLGKPIPLDLAGKLSPILPAPFMDLLGRNRLPAMVQEVGENHFRISPDLPDPVRERLSAMKTGERLSEVVDRLIDRNIIGDMDPETLSDLLVKTGRISDIAELEISQARKALKTGDQHRAMHHLWNVVKQLYEISTDPENNRLFMSATLKLSDLCLSLGTGFMELPRFLKKAREMARRLGDRRSHALVNLNLSIFLHIARQHEESSASLTEGLKAVEELGDEDILNRSAAFIGLNFFLKGMFREAEPYLERANQDFERRGGESMSLGPLPMPFLLGWCVANLGYFHDALGGLARSRRLALARSQHALANTIQAIQGTVLQMVGRHREALHHLTAAKTEAVETRNTFALAIAEGGLTYHSYVHGRLEEARASMERPSSIGGSNEFPRLFTAPHILEMICDIESEGLPVNPRLNLENEISWIRKAPNIHAKGAAFRLMAKKARLSGEPLDIIREYLEQSSTLITQSGDPIELAKTQIETVRLKMLENRKKRAAELARKARDTLSMHGLAFLFPQDVQDLVMTMPPWETTRREYRDFLAQWLRIHTSVSASEDPDQVLNGMLKFVCRLLKAERGGLFDVDATATGQPPRFCTGYNMTALDLEDEAFAPGMAAVGTVIRGKRAAAVSLDPGDVEQGEAIREIMCFPLLRQKAVSGVFYFDNTHFESRVHLLDQALLDGLAEFMSGHVDQLIEHGRLKRETRIRSSVQSMRIEQMQREELVYQSRAMARVLSEAAQVAAADTTILIQGETGVGKEVLARHLHHMSARKNGPFEVVDLTAIPETLLESELFGYEKGAFTGADQQKRGRIELAHTGTLMLDEIGEIPPSFQVKLLRLLQEKSFVRVGGTRTQNSDFRLIVATNRELEKEVSTGRFRQDLLYRLNMMPIVVPPLRERRDDIVMLARHFLSQYAVKHNKADLEILSDDIAVLTGYPWPGNVRELKNVMERAVLLSRNRQLDFSQLHSGERGAGMGAAALDSAPGVVEGLFSDTPTLDDMQRRYIRHVLNRTGGRIGGPGGASDLLGIKRTTLYGRMRRLGLRPGKRY